MLVVAPRGSCTQCCGSSGSLALKGIACSRVVVRMLVFMFLEEH
jgi:hypothetical protein